MSFLPTWLLSLFVLLLLASFGPIRAAEPLGFISEETPEGVRITENGRPVAFYQRQPKSQDGKYRRANYLHPVYDLNGQVITEDFPADHRHHRGIFWAWHQLWLGDKLLGDAWTTKDFLTVVEFMKVVRPNASQIRIFVLARWTSDLWKDDKGQAIPLVEEHTTITFHAREKSQQLIDFEIVLKPLLPDLKLGGSDDQKGYGGFSVRVKLTPDTRFRGPGGLVEPQTGAVPAGPWMDFSTTKTGVAVLDHPKNPGYPQPWILRRERSMQNPAYPGREPVALSPEKLLTLKYRLVIHDGSLEPDAINQLQQAWAKTCD